MDSYIVRVYRKKKNDPHVLVGTVEKVGTRGKAAFTNMDELWEIVDAPPRSENGERPVMPGAVQGKTGKGEGSA